MKKEDDFSIRPVYIKKTTGISELGKNAIGNLSQPIIPSKVNPTNISCNTSTQRLSPTKIPFFVGSDIRAFDSIEEAYHAFNLYVYDKDLKLEYNTDKGFDYKTIFQAIILCKFLSTVKWKFEEFRKYYRIEYQIKRFWKQSTWKASYNNLTYQFVIQTGYTSGGYIQCGSYQNSNMDMCTYLGFCITDYVRKAQSVLPMERQAEILNLLVRLSNIRSRHDIDFDLLP